MSIYIKLLLAGFLWGTNVIVMKLLLQDIPFLILATMRVFLSFLFLGMYMLWKHHSFLCEHKRYLLIIAVLSIYLNFYFTFLGMNEVKGIDNALMNALAPTLTFLLSWLFLKHSPTRQEYFAILLTVFAFLLSIRFQIFHIQKGFWYLFLGLILYMLGNVLIQKWQLGQSLTLSFYQLLFGFVCLASHCILTTSIDVSLFLNISWWKWLLLLGISGLGFAYIQVIYIQAVKVIGALQTSFFLSFNPFITYLEALLFLHESFDYLHVLSFLLLAIAIFLSKKKKESL